MLKYPVRIPPRVEYIPASSHHLSAFAFAFYAVSPFSKGGLRGIIASFSFFLSLETRDLSLL